MPPIPEVNTALLLALLPAIVGLINFFKAMGLSGKALTIGSMLTGIVAVVAYTYLPPGIFTTAYNGLVLGLAAAGLYDLAAMTLAKKTMS